MKVETCKLIGRQLNYATAVCEGKRINDVQWYLDWFNQVDRDFIKYDPVGNGSQLITIVEQQHISTHFISKNEGWVATINCKAANGQDITLEEGGGRMSVAALRVYVKSVLGDVVDIPDNMY